VVVTARDRSHLAAADRVATEAVAAVMADLGHARHGVVVDSPPGAGKSALVVQAAMGLATAREPVMVVAQTNGQVLAVFLGSFGCCVMLRWGDTRLVLQHISHRVVLVTDSSYCCLERERGLGCGHSR
jgi:hypothetical protein